MTVAAMVESTLRSLSILTSAIVLASFGMFAIDETRAASDQTAAEVAGQQASRTPTPSASQETAREKAHSPAREVIDDADDLLLSPFSAVGGQGSDWAARGVPALVALLVYGFGLGFLARYARGRG